MKKIDLHIHTSPANYEADFNFSLEKLREYVEITKLDIIAITNHNHFDYEQFLKIESGLNCKVYPGIEVDLEGGHILVICPKDETSICKLKIANNKLKKLIRTQNDYIQFNDFIEIFPDYKKYILIPHYKKDPIIQTSTINKFGDAIKIGEVTSPKKFERAKKDKDSLVPVCFSDFRANEDDANKANKCDFPTKYTYVDINSNEFGALKNALTDRSKVFLSYNKKDDEFVILPDGTTASTKLNIIMGKRSSGKTHTLDQINNSKDRNINNIKYIEQFTLTGQSEDKKFKELTEKEFEEVINNYLKPLESFVNTILKINEKDDVHKLEEYIESLKYYAKNQDLQDAFSKTKLFNEVEFTIQENIDTKNVINAVITLLESKQHEKTIYDFLSKNKLVLLLEELIKIRKNEILKDKLNEQVNSIIGVIKAELEENSSLPAISEVDYCKIFKNKILIDKFNYIINKLKVEREIHKSSIHRKFTLIIKVKPFKNTTEVKKKMSKKEASYSDAFKVYQQPYSYIHQLHELNIPTNEIYKALLDFDTTILNEKGNNLSGGEKAEYNLLKVLDDAERYDILLLDEPEASFDNIFIKKYIISKIKNISEKTTVFITTHNNTLGILTNANKLIYTSYEEGKYKVYTGEFGDKNLTTVNGDKLNSYDTILDVMEAGKDAYKERNQKYENFEN